MDRFSFSAFVICARYQRKKGKYCFPFTGGCTCILSNAGWVFTGRGTGFFVQYPFVCSFHSDKGSRIGKGDAFAVLLCACYLPFYPVFFIFVAGLFMAGIVGIFLILVRKGNRKTEIPYLPFLTFSYLIYFVSNF